MTSMIKSTDNNDDPRAAMEAARVEVLEAEKEIQSLKASIRTQGAVERDEENVFRITVVKVNGLPESAEPVFKFELSSPIEEVTLTKVGEEAIVKDVDPSVATMTCHMMDKDIPLGSSALLDVAPLCEFNLKDDSDCTINELDIAIVPADASTTESKEEVSKDSTEIKADDSTPTVSDEPNETTTEEKVAEEKVAEETVAEETVVETRDSSEDVVVVSTANKEEEAVVVKEEVQPLVPICTVKVKFSFLPSKKEMMDAHYAALNEASKRKSKAIEALRKSATKVGRATAMATPKEPPSSAVKSGFLNARKKKPIPFWKRWYEKTLGPQSIVRIVAPLFKNYALFVGAVAFFHYRGSDLALESPV